MLKKIVSIMLCMTLLLFAFAGCEKKQVETESTEIANFTMPEENEEIVVLTVKDYGEIKIKLFPDLCPKGVENFTRLIKEQNYYDGVIFHRVIKDFMIQGGDPKGTVQAVTASGETDSHRKSTLNCVTLWEHYHMPRLPTSLTRASSLS